MEFTNETDCRVTRSEMTGDIVCQSPGPDCDCLIVAQRDPSPVAAFLDPHALDGVGLSEMYEAACSESSRLYAAGEPTADIESYCDRLEAEMATRRDSF